MQSLTSVSSSTTPTSALVDLLTWLDPSNPDYKKPSLKVSSILNGNKKVHGASKMIDGLEDTCWNSEGSLALQNVSGPTSSDVDVDSVHRVDPKTVTITFHHDVQIDSLQIMFQGGFVGLEIDIEYEEKEDRNHDNSSSSYLNDEELRLKKKMYKIEPEDTNEFQSFALPIQRTSKIKLNIHKFSDFYGRVTIYHLKVLGKLK